MGVYEIFYEILEDAFEIDSFQLEYLLADAVIKPSAGRDGKVTRGRSMLSSPRGLVLLPRSSRGVLLSCPPHSPSSAKGPEE